MSTHQALKAQENSVKIENALKQVKNRPPDITTDPTIYVDEKGVTFKTTARALTTVEPPALEVPSDDQVFGKDMIPNYKFLMSHFKREGRLSFGQIFKIVSLVTEILEEEPNLVRVSCPATVVGDIHGQYYDLCNLFEMCGDPSTTQYLFLGDYVDRGDYSVEVLILLYAIKINFPTRFWLLRGNHESKRMTDYFTFKRECEVKYSLKLYQESIISFRALPICAILNDQFFCVHGGISKELLSINDVDSINRFRVDFPSRGLLCDLMWADPSPDYDSEEFDSNDDFDTFFRDNTDRHCSYFFSYKAICRFLENNKLLSVIRAHQAQDSGYRMYKVNSETGFPSVITLFSAPNYCGTYRNKAAALIYDGATFNIKQFASSPSPYHLPDFMDVFEWSLPFVAEKTLDIVMSILNICSENELLEQTPLARMVAASLKDVPEGEIETPVEVPPLEPASLEARAALRRKLLSIGRVSRMFNILREESEKVENLRTMAGGQLPRGVLVDGREALHHRLQSFSEARDADLKNEGLPPTEEEQVELKRRRSIETQRYIEEGDMDTDEDHEDDEAR